MKDLSDLGVRQSVALEDHQGLSLIRLVDGLRHWSRATPVGHLAFVRREGTIKLLLQELVAVCCGRDFAALLASGYADVLERCQTRVGGSQGFGYRMRTAQWTGSFEDDEKTFTYYCKHYRVELDHGITHCALTLASQPLLLRLDHVEDKRQFLLDLVSNRTLMRGAFLARAASLSGQGTTMKESA